MVFMGKDTEKLDTIILALKKQNEISEAMLKIMQKPENPFMKVLTIFGAGVTAFGIIHLIDTVVKWF